MVDLGSVPAHQPLGVPGLTTLPSRNERQVGDRQSPGGLTPILGMNGAISFLKLIRILHLQHFYNAWFNHHQLSSDLT